jgi:hypothetical protein
MEVAVEGPPPVKEEKRADAKPEIASVREKTWSALDLFSSIVTELVICISADADRKRSSDSLWKLWITAKGFRHKSGNTYIL